MLQELMLQELMLQELVLQELMLQELVLQEFIHQPERTSVYPEQPVGHRPQRVLPSSQTCGA